MLIQINIMTSNSKDSTFKLIYRGISTATYKIVHLHKATQHAMKSIHYPTKITVHLVPSN